jgi:antitoxin component of MazEF toxin-antitoxin module
MTSRELKITRIGNSRGVRLPAESLKRYRIGETVVMEERSDGILLRPTGPAVPKLSWMETAQAMAASGEDWSDWDSAQADGLDQTPWEPGKLRRVAEPKSPYEPGRKQGKRA